MFGALKKKLNLKSTVAKQEVPSPKTAEDSSTDPEAFDDLPVVKAKPQNRDLSPDDMMRCAFQEGDLKLAIEAKQKGGNPLAKTRYGQPFIVQAAEKNRPDLIAFLLAHGEAVDSRDNYGKTALMEAACYDCMETVQYLLEKGADIKAKDEHGKTVLINACAKGNSPDLIELLLITGANVNDCDEHGISALCAAATRGNPEVIRRLIELGAKVDYTIESGRYAQQNPLYFAVASGNAAAFETLVESGAKPTAWSHEGNTLLHIAADQTFPQLISILLDCGLDPSTENSKGQTARDIVARQNLNFAEVQECITILDTALGNTE